MLNMSVCLYEKQYHLWFYVIKREAVPENGKVVVSHMKKHDCDELMDLKKMNICLSNNISYQSLLNIPYKTSVVQYMNHIDLQSSHTIMKIPHIIFSIQKDYHFRCWALALGATITGSMVGIYWLVLKYQASIMKVLNWNHTSKS
jgi:hypothetical protein